MNEKQTIISGSSKKCRRVDIFVVWVTCYSDPGLSSRTENRAVSENVVVESCECKRFEKINPLKQLIYNKNKPSRMVINQLTGNH